MALLAIVIALLLEQVRPLAPDNWAASALQRWARAVSRNVDAGGVRHGWLAWTLAALLPALAATSVWWLLGWLGGWPLELAWSVLVLYFTLGLRQFSQHFTGIRDALESGDEPRARALLAHWQQTDAATLPRADLVRHLIEYAVLAAHRQIFGVLVWFCLLAVAVTVVNWLLSSTALTVPALGPAGAVFYCSADFTLRCWRNQSKATDLPVSPALVQAAEQAWHVADWLPARCTALAFAVVGSFEGVIGTCRAHAARFANANDGMVLAATAGALGVRLGGAALKPLAPWLASEPPVGPATHDGLPGQPPEAADFTQMAGLLWRTVALWLSLLVLLTLAHVVD
jgi:adenosylcobinamide-phosphate synthase